MELVAHSALRSLDLLGEDLFRFGEPFLHERLHPHLDVVELKLGLFTELGGAEALLDRAESGAHLRARSFDACGQVLHFFLLGRIWGGLRAGHRTVSFIEAPAVCSVSTVRRGTGSIACSALKLR